MNRFKPPADRLSRRRYLLGLAAGTMANAASSLTWGADKPTDQQPDTALPLAARPYAKARPDNRIRLPQDHGPHPEFRTEWWYFTGWFQAKGQTDPLGIQITFFRNAPDTHPDNPRRLAPRQLLFAHAAIADPKTGKLLHAERAVRVGLNDSELGQIDEHGQMTLRLGRWGLRRMKDGQWQADILTRDFDLSLRFQTTQPPWLQGEQGYSRKGPAPLQASHYITLPHLQSSGYLRTKDRQTELLGRTWMDHEWSTAVLDPRADGWDWVGLHGDDGSSLMAFVIRRQGAAPLWAHACWRSANGEIRQFSRVRFEVTDWWTSPRTGTRYPINQRLHLDDWSLQLQALMPDQELDTRASTGTIYWEGAVRVFQTSTPSPAGQAGSPATTVRWGQGYLELTGYWRPLKL